MQEPDDRDPALTAALDALRGEDGAPGASPEVEARLLREVRSIAAARRRNYVTAFAVAAVLVLAVGVAILPLTMRGPGAKPAETPAAPTHEITTAFFPLISGSLPVQGGHIVRLELPRRALASFGLGPAGSGGGSQSATVLADVIVGDDGLARAVRFVQPAFYQEQKQ